MRLYMCHALQEVMCIMTNLLLGGTLHVACLPLSPDYTSGLKLSHFNWKLDLDSMGLPTVWK